MTSKNAKIQTCKVCSRKPGNWLLTYDGGTHLRVCKDCGEIGIAVSKKLAESGVKVTLKPSKELISYWEKKRTV